MSTHLANQNPPVFRHFPSQKRPVSQSVSQLGSLYFPDSCFCGFVDLHGNFPEALRRLTARRNTLALKGFLIHGFQRIVRRPSAQIQYVLIVHTLCMQGTGTHLSDEVELGRHTVPLHNPCIPRIQSLSAQWNNVLVLVLMGKILNLPAKLLTDVQCSDAFRRAFSVRMPLIVSMHFSEDSGCF